MRRVHQIVEAMRILSPSNLMVNSGIGEVNSVIDLESSFSTPEPKLSITNRNVPSARN